MPPKKSKDPAEPPNQEDGAAMTGVWEGGTDMVVACRAPRLKQ